MQFQVLSCVDPGKHVLDGDADAPIGRELLGCLTN